MTKEQINDYLEVFILCLETEYQRSGNRKFLNIRKKINEFNLSEFIGDSNKLSVLNLGDIVSIYLSIILMPSNFGKSPDDILKIPKLVEKTSKEAAEIYKNVLSKATKQFGKINGLNFNVNFIGGKNNEEF